MKQLYREPNPDPREVASRLTSALDEAARHDMSGPDVACCLTSLLQAAREVSERGLAALVAATSLPPLLAASHAVRDRADQAIGRGGLAGPFSAMALNAVSAAVFEAAAGAEGLFHVPAGQVEEALASYGRDRRLHTLALTFVGHNFDRVYRSLIERDSDAFPDEPGLPGRAKASQLSDAVARHCRETAARVDAARHEEALAAGMRSSDPDALAQVGLVLTDLTERGLQRLAAAG